MGSLCLPGDGNLTESTVVRNRRAQKREAAIQELIDTEKTYVNGINICITKYYIRLSTETKIITNDDVKSIFGDLQTILGFNSAFLNDLQLDTTSIGKRFIEFTPFFRMYQNYCNQYELAMVLLNKYNQKESFVKLLSEIRDQNDGKTLSSLLILPIQRLPRYKLCLTEIVKYTEETHSDLAELYHALELVGETTTLINERMKEFEARAQVRSIESRFTSTVSLLKPHRKFIFESILTKVHKTGKDKEYKFILFNDVLCYASGGNDTLKMHENLPLDATFYAVDVTEHKKYNKTAFEIHSSVKSFIVYAQDDALKKKWLNHLENVMKEKGRLKPEEMEQKELAAPLMVPNNWSDVCMLQDCDTKFTFVNRRHHCRFCGRIICAKCGKNKLAHKVDKDRVVKVCKECFAQYGSVYPAKANAKEDDDSDDMAELLSGED